MSAIEKPKFLESETTLKITVLGFSARDFSFSTMTETVSRRIKIARRQRSSLQLGVRVFTLCTQTHDDRAKRFTRLGFTDLASSFRRRIQADANHVDVLETRISLRKLGAENENAGSRSNAKPASSLQKKSGGN